MRTKNNFQRGLIGTCAVLGLFYGSLSAAHADVNQAVTGAAVGSSANTMGVAINAHQQQSPPCNPAMPFDTSKFSRSTKIKNKRLQLRPGMQFILEGTASTGGVGGVHRVIFTVSNVTKVINGVRTLAVWDRDIRDGQLTERELAFFAQDDEGNVWNLAEYPEEFEDGEFAGAPRTWVSGLAGAEGGIHMFAKPQLNMPYHLQARSPAVPPDTDFVIFDCAQVSKILGKGEKVCVPVKCYENVVITQEYSVSDPPGTFQLKYYAPKAGIIQIAAIQDTEAETLLLIKMRKLSQDALDKVDNRVCQLDKRGYQYSDVYRNTAPAERDGQPCGAPEKDKDEERRNIAADAAAASTALTDATATDVIDMSEPDTIESDTSDK